MNYYSTKRTILEHDVTQRNIEELYKKETKLRAKLDKVQTQLSLLHLLSSEQNKALEQLRLDFD
jgi:hypothetical protein